MTTSCADLGWVATAVGMADAGGALINEDQCGVTNPTSEMPGLTGVEERSSSGKTSGESASPKLLVNDFHQGLLLLSLTNSPTSTGLDSNSRGGNFSGE